MTNSLSSDYFGADPGEHIPPVLVRQQLKEILASPMFDASIRNRRFLCHVVEETLEGRESRIKGYSIGISVFERDSTFDPQIDPVVRIEAGRLRRSLERYYLTDGCKATIRIAIPKGSYIPRFTFVSRDEAATRDIPRELPLEEEIDQSFFVLPFVSLSGDELGQRIAAGLSEELIAEFGKHGDVSIFTLPASGPVDERTLSNALQKIPARLLISGSVRVTSGHLRVVAHLVDRADCRHLWTACFDHAVKRLALTSLEREIGKKIAVTMIAHQGKSRLVVEKILDFTRDVESVDTDRRPAIRQADGETTRHRMTRL